MLVLHYIVTDWMDGEGRIDLPCRILGEKYLEIIWRYILID